MLARFCREHKYEAIAQWLSERHAIFVSEQIVEEIFIGLPCPLTSILADWSDCTWAAWLKRQLQLIGRFARVGEELVEVSLKTVLHMGFVGIPEDEAMIERLREEHKWSPDAESSVARSKIFATSKTPHSINRVARRVSSIPTIREHESSREPAAATAPGPREPSRCLKMTRSTPRP